MGDAGSQLSSAHLGCLQGCKPWQRAGEGRARLWSPGVCVIPRASSPCVCSCRGGSGTKGVVGIRRAFVLLVCSAPSVCGAPEAEFDPAVCLCLRHSWNRFFPCCPLWLCCIYPVYYSFICTELEFVLLLTGMRICSMGYKAVLVQACLGLKNIPEPLRVTCSGGFSSGFGQSPAQTFLFSALALCSGRDHSGFSVPEVITKILSLPWPCTWMVALLIILNPGSGSVPLGLMLQMVMLI